MRNGYATSTGMDPMVSAPTSTQSGSITETMADTSKALEELNSRLASLEATVNGAKPGTAEDGRPMSGLVDHAVKNRDLVQRALSIVDQIARGLVG